MSDIYDRVAERMATALATDAETYRIMAERRVRAVSGGADPTVEHCRLALEKCIEEKAADWRAAEAEITRLHAEIARLRLTDAQREAVQWAARETQFYDSEDHPEVVAHAATLRALLARLGGDA